MDMDTPSPSMRHLAKRLLALEAASSPATDEHAHEARRVFGKLRISLIRFAGPDSFTGLLRRAVALARAEVHSLESVKVDADGRLEGLEDVAADAANEAATAITVHLLGLLTTFIGEGLTLRLVRDAWPDA